MPAGHISARYIWRTQGDDKVRPGHAANDGQVFAWDDPPPTGHPGEGFGCRCRAEPLPTSFEERAVQTVTSEIVDAPYSWNAADFIRHYLTVGENVTLSQIGYLHQVVHHAQTYDPKNTGSLFTRVENEILELARDKTSGPFVHVTTNTYNYSAANWAIGNATTSTITQGYILEKNGYKILTAEVFYIFKDHFKDAVDTANLLNGEEYDIDIGKPFYILGTWSTHIEAVIPSSAVENPASNEVDY